VIVNSWQKETGVGHGPIPLFRGIPAPPRNVRCSSGTMEVLVTWNAPPYLLGVDGFRVYQTTENNLVWSTKDRTVRQARIKMPANTTDNFFVSSVSELGRESAKIPAQGTSDTSKYVVTGTSGETGGTGGAAGAEWSKEPSGGRYRRLE